jgi:superfamily II DNA or RNA helicase
MLLLLTVALLLALQEEPVALLRVMVRTARPGLVLVVVAVEAVADQWQAALVAKAQEEAYC